MKPRFTPPTIDQVAAYMAELRYPGDAARFVDYYEACGWVVGKSCKPMRSWQAAVRTWARNDRAWKPTAQQPLTAAERDYLAQARAAIAAGGYDIGRLWSKIRDTLGDQSLTRIKQLAKENHQ